MISSYRDLRVWQAAMELVCDVYGLAKLLPHYDLTRQVCRAAVAAPSNIAEGHERRSRRDYLHYVAVAQGSLAEQETQLDVAARLGFIADGDVQALVGGRATAVGRQLQTLRTALAAQD